MNKSQHGRLTLEKNILPPRLPGLEPATFLSRKCETHSTREMEIDAIKIRVGCRLSLAGLSLAGLSLAGAATSIIFVATNTCLSRQNYVCRDKHIFVETKLLTRKK